MKKRLFILLLCFGGGLLSYAQTLDRSVVVSQGETSQTQTMKLDWSIGEVAVLTVNTTTGIMTEGFHQPLLKVELLDIPPEVPESSTVIAASDYKIIVHPNPVSSTLTVSFDHQEESVVWMELYDLSGMLLTKKSVALPVNNTILEMADYPSGMYVLRLFEQGGNELERFKITKLH